MCKEQKFYYCDICGKIIGMVKDAKTPTICCGKPMTQIVANTEEASYEKHLPAVTVKGNEIHVSVGSVAHPMIPEHYIEWVYVQTEKGGQRKCFKAGEEPKVAFSVINDKPVAVYAYCNLHGLWKTEVK
ncbi:MAG: desulfoferrodoxin family protein [Bacilli bacterium]|jgi:superoxide reductase